MEEIRRRYPIGIQDFEQLRNNQCVYVDKTRIIYHLTHTGSMYFMSRPRRFGKSLLITTMEAYFLGKKHLFEGLAMEQLETEWTEYPVLHIDFSLTKYDRIEKLLTQLDLFLSKWENLYGSNPKERDCSARFAGVIQRAYEKTGKQVVVLIDEYDAPLLDTNSDKELQQLLRTELRSFFSPLKGLGKYLRFLFITGISKFSQVSIFSELNNLQNISMRDEVSELCGITKEELVTTLKQDVEQMAAANGETFEEACEHLKRQYDGYHFSKSCIDVFNPFSLFNAFSFKEYKNFWFASGTPTFLIDLLQRMDFNVKLLDGVDAMEEQFDAPTDTITDPIPVLYQSGYLTIKEFDPMFKLYRLAYPNNEVRYGFTESLLPSYINRFPRDNTFYIVSFIRDLMKGDVESCLQRTRSFFASIPNQLENKTEKHYQTIFYLLFRLMGQYIDVEVDSAIGRADAVVKMNDAIYVFEFKFDGTPDEALAQIDSKDYALPYEADHHPIVKVGVNFDSATRTIGEWKIKR